MPRAGAGAAFAKSNDGCLEEVCCGLDRNQQLARIVILNSSHLCHAPRMIKEAETLAEAGYYVQVLGAWFDHELKERDRRVANNAPFAFVPVIDFVDGSLAKNYCLRLRGKWASLTYKLLGVETPWQLGYAYSALRREALRKNADLYIAHSELAIGVAVELLRIGRHVAVDMEDWFSEDLLPAARRNRPLRLISKLEGEILAGGLYSSCPSNAMSRALADAYGCTLPAVVYNAFPWTERRSLDGLRKDREDMTLPSVHWFSQTVGLGRGLEELIAALPSVEHDFELHLRGQIIPGFDDWIRQRLPQRWRDRVFFHALVPNDELLSRIAEHDIGFAGEMKYARSRDLTVTNKILQYLLAGLAVVASDTQGQAEIAERAPEAVSLYPSGSSRRLAACLNALLASPDRLLAAKAAALHAAERVFCWERQQRTLLQAVKRALCARAERQVERAPRSTSPLSAGRHSADH